MLPGRGGPGCLRCIFDLKTWRHPGAPEPQTRRSWAPWAAVFADNAASEYWPPPAACRAHSLVQPCRTPLASKNTQAHVLEHGRLRHLGQPTTTLFSGLAGPARVAATPGSPSCVFGLHADDHAGQPPGREQRVATGNERDNALSRASRVLGRLQTLRTAAVSAQTKTYKGRRR